MTTYNQTITLPNSFDVESFCDTFNCHTDGDVVATWTEADYDDSWYDALEDSQPQYDTWMDESDLWHEM